VAHSALYLFLRARPVPAKLRVTTTAGEVREVPVPNGTRWGALERTVEALDPANVEALGPDGAVLRATTVEALDEPETEERADELELPEGGDVASQVSRLSIVWSKLMAEAYRHANETAFTKLVELFNAVVKRGETQDRLIASLERLVNRQYEQQFAQLEEDGGAPRGVGGIAPDLLGEMLQRMFATYTSQQKHTNGATPPKGGEA
jgi:hypothetical protein